VPRQEGANEILDLSTHPLHRDVVVVTGRDSSVRILKLFSGPPSAWPGKRDAQGFEVVELPEIGRRDDLFHQGTYRPYSRRALFSPSGSWLAVAARDKRIAFLKVSPHGERFDLDGPTFGREHMGPVMCVIADREPVTGLEEGDRARDRFFTAGYDGRVALWREEQDGGEQSWRRAKAASKVTMAGKRKGVEIIRSLVPAASGGLWAGTERGQWLRLYEFPAEESEQPVGEKVRYFPAGVFALAVYEDLLAVGLSNGKVQVFRASGSQSSYNWDRPELDVDASDAIVRSLQFIRSGKQLLVATWDGCLFRFALDRKEPLAVFRYPREQWQPEWDASQIQFDGDPFQKAKRISTRMREYLLLVQQARTQVRPD
jgi:WD40 repeat protein